MDEICFLITYATSHANGFLYGLMTWMLLMSKTVDDKNLHTLHHREQLIRGLTHVRNIAYVAKTIGKNGHPAVHDTHHADVYVANAKGVAGMYLVESYQRDTGVLTLYKAIRETLKKVVAGLAVGIQWYLRLMTERTHIVYASHMVTVLVSNQHTIQLSEITIAQHLLTKVGTAVNENFGAFRLHKRRCAQTVVPGVCTGTHPAPAAHHRYTNTCACS